MATFAEKAKKYMKDFARRPFYELAILVAKAIGPYRVGACIEKRAEYRSIVYNYVLQTENRNLLVRLWQREPKWDASRKGWGWSGGPHAGMYERGFVAFRKVTKWEFYKTVLMYYGWLDDDSNQDTTDAGYLRTLWDSTLPDYRPEVSWAKYADHYKAIPWHTIIFGCAFDLGDLRAAAPFYDKLCTDAWTDRNAAMNFQYLFGGY